MTWVLSVFGSAPTDEPIKQEQWHDRIQKQAPNPTTAKRIVEQLSLVRSTRNVT